MMIDTAPARFPAEILVAFRVRREALLRVPELVLKSIGFVAEVLGPDLTSSSLDPMATSFMVSMPSSKIATGRFYYAVTAAHIFKTPTEKPPVVIANKRGGGVKVLSMEGNWIGHPDEAVDVAVHPLLFDPEVDLAACDVEDFFDEARNPENIGIGDEVFFPGLFTPVPGVEKIIPLVRHGNLAMLPGQQIQTSEGFADLYLIEARSIGGVSGSPVFARETVAMTLTRENGAKVNMQGIGVFKLLGLIQGHWDVDEAKINQAYIVHEPKRGVNLGIAKVVPASKILETLNQPVLVARRDEQERRYLESHSSSMD